MLLPRGKLLKEPTNPATMNWLEAIHNLKEGGFSGYLDCAGEDGKGILLFVGGQLVAVRFFSPLRHSVDAEAFSRIFSRSLGGDMLLSVYRVSRDLALQIFGLLAGELLYGGQQLHLLDIPHVLDKLRQDKFSGCLRVGVAEEVVLIFYREGKPLGFFLDGNAELTSDVDLRESVARLPGATLDVIAGRRDNGKVLPDLLQSLDIQACWHQAVARAEATR
jgi:hypothetical protein